MTKKAGKIRVSSGFETNVIVRDKTHYHFETTALLLVNAQFISELLN